MDTNRGIEAEREIERQRERERGQDLPTLSCRANNDDLGVELQGKLHQLLARISSSKVCAYVDRVQLVSKCVLRKHKVLNAEGMINRLRVLRLTPLEHGHVRIKH